MTELLATKTSLVGQVEGVDVGGSSLHTWLIVVGEDKQNILGLVVRSPGGGGAP